MRPLKFQQKGKVIKARYLNDLRDAIEENRQGLQPPRQKNKPAPEGVPVSAEPPSTYIEISRTTSEVQVFDDEGTNYALIDRIDSVSFENGEGETIKLKFNN